MRGAGVTARPALAMAPRAAAGWSRAWCVTNRRQLPRSRGPTAADSRRGVGVTVPPPRALARIAAAVARAAVARAAVAPQPEAPMTVLAAAADHRTVVAAAASCDHSEGYRRVVASLDRNPKSIVGSPAARRNLVY
jgi:hypothetical protein